MRIGKKINQNVSFNTSPIPAPIDVIRKIIPRINIMGIRRKPNISLYITSDIGYLGISVIHISLNYEPEIMTSYQIKLITIPVCPKCKMMKKRLQKLQNNNPIITIEELSLQTYFTEALKRGIMDAPIILINGEAYTGIVEETTILSALDL